MSTSTEPQSGTDNLEQRVQRVGQQIRGLSESTVPPEEFAPQFVRLVIELADARAAILWTIAGDSKLSVTAHMGVQDLGLLDDQKQLENNARLVMQTVGDGDPASFHPDEYDTLPPSMMVVVAPIRVGRDVDKAIEVFLDSDIPPQLREEMTLLVSRAAQLAGFYFEQQLSQAPKQAAAATPNQSFENFERFLFELHRTLDMKHVASTATNDGRLLLGVDRLSLAVQQGKQVSIEAISGQERVNKRADEVKTMRALAEAVMKSGRPLLHSGSDEPLAPAIEEPLSRHVQTSGARMLMLMPLFDRHKEAEKKQDNAEERAPDKTLKTTGCLIVESFTNSQPPETLSQQLTVIGDHVGEALTNARFVKQIPGVGLLRMVGKTREWFHGRKLALLLAVVAGIAALIGAFAFVPYPYRVEANGRLMPTTQRRVFAPWDGDVVDILVTSGQRVTAGTPLIRLRSDELDEQLVTRRNTLNEKKQTSFALEDDIAAARREGDRSEETRLRGRLQETLIEVKGLEQQVNILTDRKERLLVKAEIGGTIATFQLDQLLANRPVTRGDVLMEIMQDGGPWQLEVRIPTERMGHLLNAITQGNRGERTVEFLLETEPENTFEGKLLIDQIATRSAVSGEEGSIVEARIGIDKEQLPIRWIGADATAKIDCGNHSLGYVLFGDVLEFLQKTLWL